MKPQALIENWFVMGDSLGGRIFDHPRQEEFKEDWQRTSKIVKLDEEAGTCETLNTIYKLGKKGL